MFFLEHGKVRTFLTPTLRCPMEKTTTQELLAQAEKICAQRNVRLTPQRLEVLRLMSLQDGAISAYDLLDLLREAEPQAKPPTVYRALDCDRCGAVKEECAEGVEDIMHTLAAKMGFALRHNVIEAHGLCAACVEVEACRHPEQCQHDHSVQVKKKPR